jgi:hypothetical protein
MGPALEIMEQQAGAAPDPEHVTARLEFEDAEAWSRSRTNGAN